MAICEGISIANGAGVGGITDRIGRDSTAPAVSVTTASVTAAAVAMPIKNRSPLMTMVGPVQASVHVADAHRFS